MIIITGLKALLTLWQVIVLLVVLVLGGAFALIGALFILVSFGPTTADDFLDRLMDAILIIGIEELHDGRH